LFPAVYGHAAALTKKIMYLLFGIRVYILALGFVGGQAALLAARQGACTSSIVAWHRNVGWLCP
jgi:hypothetical protein